MELIDYIKIFGRAKKLIIFGTLLVVLITALFIATGKTRYDTSLTLTIDRVSIIDQKTTPYYLYDGYYAQQAGGLFAQTVGNWMISPSVVKSIYANADVDLPDLRSSTQLGKLFTVKQFQPATVDITLRSTDSVQSEKLLNSANTVLQGLTDETNAAKTDEKYVLRASGPVSVKVQPFWALDITLAVVIGLVLTTFLAMLGTYLKKDSN
ncbi:MAG: hypothetical protein WC773_01580 [Patescibacteria group bacterium]